MNKNLEDCKKEILNDISRTISFRLCSIGVDLGLFEDLSINGPSTSKEIAFRKNYNERYIREWLYGISKTGYIYFDKETRKASISNEYSELFNSEGGKNSFKGFFKVINNMLLPYEKLISSFKNGGGIKFEEYNNEFWKGLDLTGCSRYRSFLVPEWIDQVPEIREKLDKGVKFADFGCGTGRSAVELAKRFKNSTFFGFDKFKPNIEEAQINARSGDVTANTSFQVWDADEGGPDDKFDIAGAFDLIHDLPHPQEGIKAIKNSLKPGGIFLLMDIKCTEDPIDNDDPMALFKFGASLHFCMTTSLAYDGIGLGTVGLPLIKVEELCFNAGFKNVKEIDINHPINSLFLIS